VTPPRPFLAAAALLTFGLAAGAALDEAPARPPVVRAGLRVLEADFHAHTRFSDGFLSPFGLVLHARQRGLDAFAITEHNNLFPALMGRWFSERIGGPTVLAGEEVTTASFHLHGIGLSRRVDASQPLDRILDDIHAQGAIAIAAHPVKRYWPAFTPVRDRLDATELMHPIAFGGRGGRGGDGWLWEDMRAFYEKARADGFHLTAIGSSDYHFFSPLGVTRTLVFAERNDEPAILDALRRGRTVVFDLEGRAYGDPALIEALEREPYAMRPQDYGYRGSGPLDRAARLLGWLGLLGVVLLRRERSA
jgi:hypothetical protein